MSILDQIAVKPAATVFRPASPGELFALRLAQKLGEPAAISHYLDLAARYSSEVLLAAFRRAMNGGSPPSDLARRFHSELSISTRNGYPHRTERLLAIKVERRSVAVAVFVGSRLEYHDVRQLSSQSNKAESSALGFVRWIMDSYAVESVSLEMLTNGDEIRRAVLSKAIVTMFRAAAMPVWEVRKADLLSAYGQPPLRSRKELRAVTQSIVWAMLNTDKPHWQELDAAALGLYVQTERLFLY